MEKEPLFTIHHTEAAKIYLDQAMELIGKAMKQTMDAKVKGMIPKAFATQTVQDLERIHDDLTEIVMEL